MTENGHHRIEGIPVFPPGCPDTRPPDLNPETVRYLDATLTSLQRLATELKERAEQKSSKWHWSWSWWPWQRDKEVAELRAKLATAEIERDVLAESLVALRMMVKAQYAWSAQAARMMGWNEHQYPLQKPQH